MQRIPRRLDPIECRVLGSLLEKEQATPEYYPMTVHALVAACNQKNNREPVLELAEGEVEAALRRLFEDVLVWRAEGPRALKWSHNLDRRWSLTPATKAIVTLLLLRGAQTPGELRGRAERLHAFASVGEVEAALGELAAGEEPLVVELARGAGQKEPRWRQLVGEETAAGVAAAPPAATPLAARVDALAAKVVDLERRLGALESELRERAERQADAAQATGSNAATGRPLAPE
jgi:uncharacterized protein YceH (UPF0502 family)